MARTEAKATVTGTAYHSAVFIVASREVVLKAR
jgi:hypothetical protein